MGRGCFLSDNVDIRYSCTQVFDFFLKQCTIKQDINVIKYLYFDWLLLIELGEKGSSIL